MHIFIKSKADHKHHRDALRKLTGGIRVIKNGCFRTIFVTGYATNELQTSVRRESESHGDILQVAVPEQYRWVKQSGCYNKQFLS